MASAALNFCCSFRLPHKNNALHCHVEDVRAEEDKGKRRLTTWKKIWKRNVDIETAIELIRHTRQTGVKAFREASSPARLTDENKEEEEEEDMSVLRGPEPTRNYRKIAAYLLQTRTQVAYAYSMKNFRNFFVSFHVDPNCKFLDTSHFADNLRMTFYLLFVIFIDIKAIAYSLFHSMI